MYRDRILMAIDVLTKVEKEHKPFNMNDWVEVSSNPMDCNTAACALGWLCRDPRFQQLGLGLQSSRPDKHWATPVLRMGAFKTIRYEVDAGAAVLGITFKQGMDLFSTNYYPVEDGSSITPAMVIERLQSLLRR